MAGICCEPQFRREDLREILRLEDWDEVLLGKNGAGDEARTRNFQLGKLTLYH